METSICFRRTLGRNRSQHFEVDSYGERRAAARHDDHADSGVVSELAYNDWEVRPHVG
jgi:hypothetical protein